MSSAAVLDNNTTLTTTAATSADLTTTAHFVNLTTTTDPTTTSVFTTSLPTTTSAFTTVAYNSTTAVIPLTTATTPSNQSDSECLRVLYDQINGSGQVFCSLFNVVNGESLALNRLTHSTKQLHFIDQCFFPYCDLICSYILYLSLMCYPSSIFYQSNQNLV